MLLDYHISCEIRLDVVMRVLEIGGGPNPRSIQDNWKRKDVTVLDAQLLEYTDIQHAVTVDNHLPFDDETFDVVFSSHILEHLPYWAEYHIMSDWVRVLKSGGAIHTIVPSWEWVAKEVLKPPEKRSRGLRQCAFAGQDNEWDRHMNMFTLDMLEKLKRDCKLTIRTSTTRIWPFVVHGQTFRMGENYVVGVKR